MTEHDIENVFDISELNVEFVFGRRPIALPGDLRPTWRIGLLMLLLAQCCRQQRSSLTRLHVLNWAMRSEENHENLMALISQQLRPDALVVRFDPAFNRAIDFALGENLVQRVDGSRIELTQQGRAFAADVLNTPDVYINEKRLIGAIKQKASETLVENIFGIRK
ncbi:hypothetical protein [Achromobacter sp. UMC46]|uniref:hypothetical protein n=1 Tax=Achromobacter sp. UMC46 TaxID=1862319 RepID=UPI0016007F36|nr:hypothetical protein [Achromobacter sp. UMC46]MBB1592554.1 hypothetical protein [Achromobacter sp. UMC46]MBB1598376.1 hypothetical protein [Achromobacter sp. UMC46]